MGNNPTIIGNEDILDIFTGDDEIIPPTEARKPENTEEAQEDDPLEIEQEEEKIDKVVEEDKVEEESVEESDSDEDDNDEDDDEDDSDENDSDVLTAYYEQLKESNFLEVPKDFEFDGSEEKFQEALTLSKNSLKDKALEEFWNELPMELKDAFNYTAQTGKGLRSYLEEADKDYSKIDVSTKDAQREALRDYYKQTTKYGEDKIEKFIKRIEDSGDLEEEALDAVEQLVGLKEEREETRLAKEKLAKKQEDENFKAYKESMEKAIVNSKVISKKDQNKLKSFMFNVVTVNGEQTTKRNKIIKDIYSNPEHEAELAALLWNYDPDKGFDYSYITNKHKSETVSSIKKSLNKKLKKLPKSTKKAANTPVINWETILDN